MCSAQFDHKSNRFTKTQWEWYFSSFVHSDKGKKKNIGGLLFIHIYMEFWVQIEVLTMTLVDSIWICIHSVTRVTFVPVFFFFLPFYWFGRNSIWISASLYEGRNYNKLIYNCFWIWMNFTMILKLVENSWKYNALGLDSF